MRQNAIVNVRLSQDLAARLQHYAAARRQTRSAILREIIRDALVPGHVGRSTGERVVNV